MFRFLFGTKNEEPVIETQRQTVDRALSEINEILAAMAAKPKVSLDLESGEITLDLPDQMPDETLALPAPDPEPVAEEVVEAPADETAEAPAEKEAA